MCSIIVSVVLWQLFACTHTKQGLIFTAVMVRASQQYHSSTFMNGSLSLPTYFETE
ncbi:uncharacterized protein PHACADRAFT_252229 [Phanerochaete carnosa HHB-10118-sp]|uniref:Uncharacterized protein n=1 Tax=Phanerochaete carnosa (strain HHB-10118-sp) TaxID=650164 RepID=K5W2P0_PHACS|nr:uncharacterized protein PHACADRAFT_252229 [Phanerochaete carnosa HHB-10118-sp]EKM58148.1 hypothetical protein PHACADRAFT_252229 [Phanerochaete carnosa HHB-10118-sp]